MKSVSFNTVDGFVIGTGMKFSSKTGQKGRLTVDPSVKYAYSREKLMWTVSANNLYNPMTAGSFLHAQEAIRQASPVGINPFLNTVSSLFFRNNPMKLYNGKFITAGHRGDLANRLNLSLSGMWEKREVLQNTNIILIFQSPEKVIQSIFLKVASPPEIQNPARQSCLSNHNSASFTAELSWTPRQRYRIRNGVKLNEGSDWPTFKMFYKHGYNYND